MTTWYTYSIDLSKGILASAMAKIEEILHRQNWTYDRFLYHARQPITVPEPDAGKAIAYHESSDRAISLAGYPFVSFF